MKICPSDNSNDDKFISLYTYFNNIKQLEYEQ